MSNPRVSIGMPVYNEGSFIDEALDSLLSQSFEDLEVIISDNASTDNTQDICLQYAAKDPRIRYYRAESNRGGIVNFNRTFELSHAEYFFWASGHDLREETFISRCVEIMDNDASVVLCYSLAGWISSDHGPADLIPGRIDTKGLDRLSGFNTVLWGLSYAYPIYGIIRSSSLRKTGLMRNVIGPDIVLLAELSLLGKFSQVCEPLLYLRRLADFGDWRQYLLKSFGYSFTMRAPFSLYCKLIYELMRVVAVQVKGYREKSLLMLSVVLCMLTKYQWALRGLRQTGNVQGAKFDRGR